MALTTKSIGQNLEQVDPMEGYEYVTDEYGRKAIKKIRNKKVVEDKPAKKSSKKSKKKQDE